MTSRQQNTPPGFRPGYPDSMAAALGGQLTGRAQQPTVELFNISTELFNRVEVPVDPQDPTGPKKIVLVSPPIDADGAGIYNLPPIGESIIVPQNVAETLIRKTRTQYRPGHRMAGKNRYAEGMTTDPELAAVVKDAYDRGISLDEAVAEYNSSALSDDMILKLAQERNLIPAAPKSLVQEPDNETLIRLIKERQLLDELKTMSNEESDKQTVPLVPPVPLAPGKAKNTNQKDDK